MVSNDKAELTGVFGKLPFPTLPVTEATIAQAPALAIPAHLRHLHAPTLVDSWWHRLMAVIREPVSVHQVDGERVVVVVATACVRIRSDGSIKARLWVRQNDAMCWIDLPDHDIILGGMPTGLVWLKCIASACSLELKAYLVREKITHQSTDLDNYLLRVFERFGVEMRRHCDLRLMRRKVAQALNLNEDAMRLSQRMIPRLPDAGSLPANNVRPTQYNLALKHIDKLLQLECELPVIVSLYAALLGNETVAQDPEPIRAVRVYLESQGVKPKTWRMLTKASTRFFWPVRHFYKGSAAPAMLDYLLVVQTLGLAQAPDTALMWDILSRYANSGARRPAINPGFETIVRRFAPVAQAYMAQPDRHAQRGLLEPMLEWLASEHCADLTKSQRKAGWPWLVRQTQDWLEQRSVQLESQGTRWPVPIDSANIGAYAIRPLRSAFDLWQESRAMRHCADTFTAKCIDGQALLVSMRHERQPDKRLATAWYSRQDDVWNLEQVRGFANRDPDPGAAQAAAQLTDWLNGLRQPEPVSADGVWEPEQTTKLRELFVRHNLHVGRDRDSQPAQAATMALVDALARYKRQFWWVYRVSGPYRYESSTPSTGELMLMAAKGEPLELKGGPFPTQAEAQASIDAAQRDTEPYRPEPGVAQDGHPGAVAPIERPKTAKLVVDLHWCTADKLHGQRYALSSNRGASLWVLWQQYGDGKRWQAAHAVAHMARKGIDEVAAAKLLLKHALEDERADQMGRFNTIGRTGLLGKGCVSALADEVWHDDGNSQEEEE